MFNFSESLQAATDRNYFVMHDGDALCVSCAKEEEDLISESIADHDPNNPAQDVDQWVVIGIENGSFTCCHCEAINRQHYNNGEVKITTALCDDCAATTINGALCHERGCPSEYKDSERECNWCGFSFYPATRYQVYCSDDCAESAM